MPEINFPTGLGSLIAIVVLLLAILLAVLGKLPWLLAGLIIALAAARLT